MAALIHQHGKLIFLLLQIGAIGFVGAAIWFKTSQLKFPKPSLIFSTAPSTEVADLKARSSTLSRN